MVALEVADRALQDRPHAGRDAHVRAAAVLVVAAVAVGAFAAAVVAAAEREVAHPQRALAAGMAAGALLVTEYFVFRIPRQILAARAFLFHEAIQARCAPISRTASGTRLRALNCSDKAAMRRTRRADCRRRCARREGLR